jgi:uncharacterized Ntn-hydrolase superfamily protein
MLGKKPKPPVNRQAQTSPIDAVELTGTESRVAPSQLKDQQAQLATQAAAAAAPGPAGLTTAYCSTYSIVARCPDTGRLGVAVESHWFDVRNTVAWVQPGVGAVATQAATNQAFGPRGLSLMKEGNSPQETLAVLQSEDPVFERRQLGMVDTQGRVAGNTGELCVGHANSHAGAGYIAQANLMENEGVPEAMGEAFEKTEGPLEQRLMAALKAAENKGGDIRGGQSAALVVMEGESSGNPLLDRVVDLTVPDHPQPVHELERLLKLHQDYSGYGELLEAAKHGETKKVKGLIDNLSPESAELKFWSSLELYNAGEKEQALDVLGGLFAQKPGFRAVLPRLVPAKILPGGADKAILKATGEQ